LSGQLSAEQASKKRTMLHRDPPSQCHASN
jgi:hypothetical protein